MSADKDQPPGMGLLARVVLKTPQASPTPSSKPDQSPDATSLPSTLVEEIALHIREFRTTFIRTRQLVNFRRESGSSEHDNLINTMVEVLDHQMRTCSAKFHESVRKGGNEDSRLIQLALEFQRLRTEAKNMVQQAFGDLGSFGADDHLTSEPHQISKPTSSRDHDVDDHPDETGSVYSDAASSSTAPSTVRRRRVIRKVIRKRKSTRPSAGHTLDAESSTTGTISSGAIPHESLPETTLASTVLEDSMPTTATQRKKLISTAGGVTRSRGYPQDDRDVLNETFIDYDSTSTAANQSFISSSSEVYPPHPRFQTRYRGDQQDHSQQRPLAQGSAAASFSATSKLHFGSGDHYEIPSQAPNLDLELEADAYPQDNSAPRRVSRDGSRTTVVVRKKLVRKSLPNRDKKTDAEYSSHVPTHLLPSGQETSMASKGVGDLDPLKHNDAKKLRLLGHGPTIPEALRNAGYDQHASRYPDHHSHPELRLQHDQESLVQMQTMHNEDVQGEITQEEIRTTARLQALLDEQLLRDQALAHIEREGSQLADVAAQLGELAVQQGETVDTIEDEVAKSRARATQARREVVRAAPKYRLPLAWIGSLAGAALAGPAGFFVIGLGLKGALIVSGAGAIVGAVAGRGVSGALATANARQGMVFRPRPDHASGDTNGSEHDAEAEHEPSTTVPSQGDHSALPTVYSPPQSPISDVSSDPTSTAMTRGWHGFSQLFARMQDDVDSNLERSFLSEGDSETESVPALQTQSLETRSQRSTAYESFHNIKSPQRSPTETTRGPTAVLTRAPTEIEWRQEQQMLPRRYDIQPTPLPMDAREAYAAELYETSESAQTSQSFQSLTLPKPSEPKVTQSQESGFFSTIAAFFGGTSKKPSIYTTPMPPGVHDCKPEVSPTYLPQTSTAYEPTRISAHPTQSTRLSGPSFSVVSSELEAAPVSHPLRRPLPTHSLRSRASEYQEDAPLHQPLSTDQYYATPLAPPSTQTTVSAGSSTRALRVQDKPSLSTISQQQYPVSHPQPTEYEEFEPASTWELPPMFESREKRRARLRMEARAAAQSLNAPVSSAPMLEDATLARPASVRQSQQQQFLSSPQDGQSSAMSSYFNTPTSTSSYLSRPYEAVSGIMGSVSEVVSSGASNIIRAFDLQRKPVHRDWSMRLPDEPADTRQSTSTTAAAATTLPSQQRTRTPTATAPTSSTLKLSPPSHTTPTISGTRRR